MDKLLGTDQISYERKKKFLLARTPAGITFWMSCIYRMYPKESDDAQMRRPLLVIVPIMLLVVCTWGRWNAVIRLSKHSVGSLPYQVWLLKGPWWQTSNLSMIVH